MCGRYTLAKDLERLLIRFGLSPVGFDLRPRFNIAPGQDVPVITGSAGRRLDVMRWGLVPPWAEDENVGFSLINARAETLAERPAFRESYRRRRCLVPADGFYEWRRQGRMRSPLRYALKSGGIFPMAGLWEAWRGPDGRELRSFSIVTTEANALIRPVHDRMPVILPPEAEPLWLDPSVGEPALLAPLLQPFPSEALEAREVSPFVNAAKNEGPDCFLPPEAVLSRQGELF